MAISHRLHCSMVTRPDEGINEAPKRIVFLSVEGNHTEKDYFRYVDKYKEKLGIHALVHIETLSRRRSDTRSDPENVLALLTDYLAIRDEGILPEELYAELIECGENGYSKEYIAKYLNNELPNKDSKKLQSAIQLAGIAIDYQKFLSQYKGSDNNDVFAIIIDRDRQNHSEDLMQSIYQKCQENGLKCFVTNPCFEFWLLLHVSDISEEYKNCLNDMLCNEKISAHHTYISSILSEKTNHGKSIPEPKFQSYYLENIDIAIERAEKFSQTEEELLNQLGSNIPKLFEILREKPQ